jgi:hypothetical protein
MFDEEKKVPRLFIRIVMKIYFTIVSKKYFVS